MAAETPVELIEFVRPCRNQINLYITNISKDLNELEAQRKLHKIFSNFGLLYETQVIDTREKTEERQSSPNETGKTLYAFVKFYSAKAALKAQNETNGKWLLGGQFLKVQFANRKKCVDAPVPLYIARCIELANYYLGFNGWSSKIIKVNTVTKQYEIEAVDKDEQAVLSQESNHFMFRCVLRLEIKTYDCYCEGTGYGGDKNVFDQEKDPLKKLELTAIGKKIAHRHAFENAFQRVIIIALDNGKVDVEINQMDIPHCEMIGLSEAGIIKVNYKEEPIIDEEIDDEDMLEALDALVNYSEQSIVDEEINDDEMFEALNALANQT